MNRRLAGLSIGALLSVGACGGGGAAKSWQCTLPAGDGGGADEASTPDFLSQVGCLSDFEALASEPLDATLPGARSGKVVLDQFPGAATPADTLYFQNSKRFQIHYQFASKDLTGPDHPQVAPMGTFSANEYTSLDRRFILGAVTYYEGADAWTLELAPYDTASAEMIVKLFDAVKANAYFGAQLAFHPTSEAVEAVAARAAGKHPDQDDQRPVRGDRLPAAEPGDDGRAAQVLRRGRPRQGQHLRRVPGHRRARPRSPTTSRWSRG